MSSIIKHCYWVLIHKSGNRNYISSCRIKDVVKYNKTINTQNYDIRLFGSEGTIQINVAENEHQVIHKQVYYELLESFYLASNMNEPSKFSLGDSSRYLLI